MATSVKIDHLFFFAIIISCAIVAPSDDDCVYTVYVKTGSVLKAGTDSFIIISLTLYDVGGDYVQMFNLETWGGLMGKGHNYFERGNLDIFSGRGRCLGTAVCTMNLTSEGSGFHHGWYCNYVEVTSTGPNIPSTQQLFTVEQWIALDAPPYELTTIRNYCPYHLRTFSSTHQHIPLDFSGPGLFDVFINHRGTDTKRNFAALLYDRLVDLKLHPFLDYKSLNPGVPIQESIESAVRDCKVGVTIFSPNYFVSAGQGHRGHLVSFQQRGLVGSLKKNFRQGGRDLHGIRSRTKRLPG